MRFTIKQLRYFDAALRTGSIARAAQEMSISQSSITAAIDMIESSLGGSLFRRVPAKGLITTETGRDVGVRVAEFLDQCRIFDSDLMSLDGSPTGTLRLACYAPTAPFVLPPLLKRIAKIYPAVRIDIKEGDMQQIADLLYSGAVDMALTYQRVTRQGQPFLQMFKARPFALIAQDSPLARRSALRLEDLADLPMIMLDLPTTQAYFGGLFSSQGLEPKVVHRTKSSSVLRGLVAANLGYAILNIYGHGDQLETSGYACRPLLGQLDEPDFGVAYTANAQRSTVLKAVLTISRDLVQEGHFSSLCLRPRNYAA